MNVFKKMFKNTVTRLTPQSVKNNRLAKENNKLTEKVGKLDIKKEQILKNHELKKLNGELKDKLIKLKNEVKDLKLNINNREYINAMIVNDPLISNIVKEKTIQNSPQNIVNKNEKEASNSPNNVIDINERRNKYDLKRKDGVEELTRRDVNYIFKMFKNNSITLSKLEGNFKKGYKDTALADNEYNMLLGRLKNLEHTGHVNLDGDKYTITDKGLKDADMIKRTYEFNVYDIENIFKLIQGNGGKINEQSLKELLSKEFSGDKLEEKLNYDTYRFKKEIEFGFLDTNGDGYYTISDKGLQAMSIIKQDPSASFIEFNKDKEFNVTNTTKDLNIFLNSETGKLSYDDLSKIIPDKNQLNTFISSLIDYRTEGILNMDSMDVKESNYSLTDKGKELLGDISDKGSNTKSIRQERLDIENEIKELNAKLKGLDSEKSMDIKDKGEVISK